MNLSSTAFLQREIPEKAAPRDSAVSMARLKKTGRTRIRSEHGYFAS